MNYFANNSERDYVTLGAGNFPIHDLLFSGEQFPQEPFIIYTSHLVFSTSQLHGYLRQHFDIIRQCELENLYSPVFARNVPVALFCGIFMSYHVVSVPLTPQMYSHFSSGRVRTPHWFPMSMGISTESVGRQNWVTTVRTNHREITRAVPPNILRRLQSSSPVTRWLSEELQPRCFLQHKCISSQLKIDRQISHSYHTRLTAAWRWQNDYNGQLWS